MAMFLGGLCIIVLVYLLSKFLTRFCLSFNVVSVRHQTVLILVWCFFLLLLTHLIFFHRDPSASSSPRDGDVLPRDGGGARGGGIPSEGEYPWGLGALMRVASAEEDASKLAVMAEQHVKRIKESCGEVCRSSTWSDGDDAHARKRFDCRSLFAADSVHDAAGAYFRAEVPKRVSADLLSHFTYDGRVRLSLAYRAFDLQPPRDDWSKDYVDSMVLLAQRGQFAELVKETSEEGGMTEEKARLLYSLLTDSSGDPAAAADRGGEGDRYGSVLVIGAQQAGGDRPVVEALALAAGAGRVVTVDRMGLQSFHPQIEIVRPSRMSHLHQIGARFDLVVAFESLQSLGLGRFGEGLHPWLDRVSAARAWCLAEDDGQLLLALPRARVDQVVFNSHRLYGSHMLWNLLANWKESKRSPDESSFAHLRSNDEYPLLVKILDKDSTPLSTETDIDAITS